MLKLALYYLLAVLALPAASFHRPGLSARGTCPPRQYIASIPDQKRTSTPNQKRINIPNQKRASSNPRLDTNNDGSTFIWVIQDTYSGKSFFDRWDFWDQKDPTNGSVEYVNASTAFSSGLAYVDDQNRVIMKGDQSSWLPKGTYRPSVRISSKTTYQTGLFILDLNKAPWGCGTWPAFWTLGSGQWPYAGEIDIIEGVHDNEHNQVAFHTADVPGCSLTTSANFTGTIVSSGSSLNTDCNGCINQNAGCGIIDWSRASYGPYFDSQGGGVFAMKWDENSISVWNFYRAAIPADILAGEPNPSTWTTPTATLLPDNCNITANFVQHSIIFDITFCGDWAGNSYATSGCPGTCEDRLMDPGNFVNATWDINYLKVYRKQAFAGTVDNSSPSTTVALWTILLSSVVVLVFMP